MDQPGSSRGLETGSRKSGCAGSGLFSAASAESVAVRAGVARRRAVARGGAIRIDDALGDLQRETPRTLLGLEERRLIVATVLGQTLVEACDRRGGGTGTAAVRRAA